MKARRLQVFVALLSLMSLPALAELRRDIDYRVKLTKDTGGLNILVRASSGPAVVVGLENRSGKSARCTASFVSDRHAPTMDETRSTTVAPGKTATLAYPAGKLGGNFSTAFVNVKCRAR